MSQLQFSKRQHANVLYTDEIVKAGTVQSITNFEITRIFPMVYFNNVNPVTQAIRAIIYSRIDYSTAIFTSDWFTIASLTTIGPYARWYIPISFNRFNIEKNVVYYLAFQIGNYTKINANWIGIEYDLVDSIHADVNLITDSPFRYLVEGYAKPIQYS